jgi:hypothetical protein
LSINERARAMRRCSMQACGVMPVETLNARPNCADSIRHEPRGRRYESSAIVAFHQPLFDKWVKGTRLVGEVTSVRFVAPDVALMHAIGSTIMRGASKRAAVRDSIQTLVARRTSGRWAQDLSCRTRRSEPRP